MSTMNNADLLDAIVGVLSGKEWSADTPQTIAELLRENGYEVADVDDAPLIEHGDRDYTPVHALSPAGRFVVETDRGNLLCDRHGRVVGVDSNDPALSLYVYVNVGEYNEWAEKAGAINQIKHTRHVDVRCVGKWYRCAAGRIEYLSPNVEFRSASRVDKT